VDFSFQTKKCVRISNGLRTYHTFIPAYFNGLDEGGLFKVFMHRDFQFCPFYLKRRIGWTIFHKLSDVRFYKNTFGFSRVFSCIWKDGGIQRFLQMLRVDVHIPKSCYSLTKPR
jgi:hypothetical protein